LGFGRDRNSVLVNNLMIFIPEALKNASASKEGKAAISFIYDLLLKNGSFADMHLPPKNFPSGFISREYLNDLYSEFVRREGARAVPVGHIDSKEEKEAKYLGSKLVQVFPRLFELLQGASEVMSLTKLWWLKGKQVKALPNWIPQNQGQRNFCAKLLQEATILQPDIRREDIYFKKFPAGNDNHVAIPFDTARGNIGTTRTKYAVDVRLLNTKKVHEYLVMHNEHCSTERRDPKTGQSICSQTCVLERFIEGLIDAGARASSRPEVFRKRVSKRIRRGFFGRAKEEMERAQKAPVVPSTFTHTTPPSAKSPPMGENGGVENRAMVKGARVSPRKDVPVSSPHQREKSLSAFDFYNKGMGPASYEPQRVVKANIQADPLLQEEKTKCCEGAKEDLVLWQSNADHASILPFYVPRRLAKVKGSREILAFCKALSHVILDLWVEVFGQPLQKAKRICRVTYDDRTENVAFNKGGQLFFNSSYFKRNHHKIGDPATYNFWFVSMCHELSHNTVGPHNRAFVYEEENILKQCLTKFACFLNKRLDRTRSHR